ncbi:BTB/POZ and MATH domain-containing protein 2 [Brachypodium distachyon]|uniref:BTB domain-containing protein n=1 Tax=Brachypodium distachyon TaxID=15368 RepID=A0A0Q3EA62_BRADI|nr:BTB/POZ and MATH domain-containing protein 2 [Brachypodium distachyon]KQJ84719.1 hypothetical protein BRADI_5g22435v3 [Brachypodium distachyon]|eukprot:XP_010227278.1 BTB/POZ and MATH domain-containing protein 2 [Brachypodium distachyon]
MAANNSSTAAGGHLTQICRSLHTTEDVTATLDLEVAGYSTRLVGMGAGESVGSETFSVGGHDWDIRFFPDGDGHDDCAGRAVTYLRYLGQSKEKIRAWSAMSVLAKDGRPVASVEARELFFAPDDMNGGDPLFLSKSMLKSLSELGGDDDGFTIRCVLTVRTVSGGPPTELPGQLERVLSEGTGADVTFRVGGRKFRAHRALLAARSPVFRAQLFGPAVEEKKGVRRRVKVVGVEPAVFQMMLHYIYTDSLPPCAGDDEVAVQHLLVAADRYGLDRLKLMCEEELSKRIEVDNIVSTFALAKRHHCKRLKDACLMFMTLPDVLDVVLETDGFKAHFMTCQPMDLEGGCK